MKLCETIDRCPLEIIVGAQSKLKELEQNLLSQGQFTGEIKSAISKLEKIKDSFTRCSDCVYQ